MRLNKTCSGLKIMTTMPSTAQEDFMVFVLINRHMSSFLFIDGENRHDKHWICILNQSKEGTRK